VLRELRDRDSESGLLTSSSFYQGLLREVARSERYGNKLSLIRVGLRGLSRGNRGVVLPLASKLADNVRTIDYAGRWSDSVFLLLLPETDAAGAQMLVDKLQEVVKAPAFAEHREAGIKIDIDVVEWEHGEDASALLARIGA